MSILKRYIEDNVIKDLKNKMVFVAGPRQVGKTTLAKSILLREGSENGYLSWDITEHREDILRNRIPLSSKLIVFDEIHKFKGYRNFIKGLYDGHKDKIKILVTGSGMLETFKYSGDSLQGRYHLIRLFPLSFAELKMQTYRDIELLLRLGGFPEPFFSSSEEFSRRWSREYRTRIVYEEIRSIERLNEIYKIEMLSLRLPELVGSPLSINSLREDIEVSHKTISDWINILERLYAIIRIPPFGPPRLKAIKKMMKHYHFDWTLVEDEGKRFENLLAIHLCKWIAYMQDTKGYDYDLRYYRDKEGREIDFVVLNRLKPIMFVEAKLSDKEISESLKYMRSKYPDAKFYQVCLKTDKEFAEDGITLISATNFLKTLI